MSLKSAKMSSLKDKQLAAQEEAENESEEENEEDEEEIKPDKTEKGRVLKTKQSKK